MSNHRLFKDACKLILKTLDTKEPKGITLDEREMGFYRRADISPERNTRAQILSDAFVYLRNEGLITYSSSERAFPKTDLKLTPKGMLRPRNPFDSYKEEGLKAAIKAALELAFKLLQDRFKSRA